MIFSFVDKGHDVKLVVRLNVYNRKVPSFNVVVLCSEAFLVEGYLVDLEVLNKIVYFINLVSIIVIF